MNNLFSVLPASDVPNMKDILRSAFYRNDYIWKLACSDAASCSDFSCIYFLTRYVDTGRKCLGLKFCQTI
jgi:hypothetical protein